MIAQRAPFFGKFEKRSSMITFHIFSKTPDRSESSPFMLMEKFVLFLILHFHKEERKGKTNFFCVQTQPHLKFGRQSSSKALADSKKN